MKSVILTFISAIIAMMLTGCGVQEIPRAKNKVDEAGAEITNQYKRRADLIPNLVKVVKGYATHEKDTLEGVVNARAKATSMNVDISKAKPEDLQKYQQAQGELSQALGRLMMITENYPQLKADQNFRDLQAQLEGTENRITNARRQYIETIRMFNDLVTVFPTNFTNKVFFHYDRMAQWTVTDAEKDQVEKAPAVEF